ncbi:MAG: membrane protein insertion efficiency factor YidD [Deltaproteobacteria bacterium]|nr:membrane protein insertion efficiency factor YidD [Deltaproteobacteria bacterium]
MRSVKKEKIARPAPLTRGRPPGRPKAALVLLLLALGAALLGLVDLQEPAAWPVDCLARPFIAFYRAGPGRLLPHHCPSHPHCSAYAQQALDRHGLILGGLVAVDRLIGEQSRIKDGPWRVIQGQVKTLDPLEANTFWWAEP